MRNRLYVIGPFSHQLLYTVLETPEYFMVNPGGYYTREKGRAWIASVRTENCVKSDLAVCFWNTRGSLSRLVLAGLVLIV